MKTARTIITAFLLILSTAAGAKDGYVVVTRYLKANSGNDVSDDIQKVIDKNPNRTIYFPDGEYIISKPILTPAEPEKSVSLELSNYAVIRASDDWDSDEAMIRLGGKDPANNIRVPGSNYYLSGGIIDGNLKAKAISIDSGRETMVRNCSIKRAIVGLHIKYGANSGSSDCDIMDLNIVCAFKPECIGILVEGFDNTFTNIRISGAKIGVKLVSAGNYLRNIHPLYLVPEFYEDSIGFLIENGNNWMDFCYSDQYATGFQTGSQHCVFDNCFVYWYSNYGKKHTAIKSTGAFNLTVTNFTVGMGEWNKAETNYILEFAEDGGKGVFNNLSIDDTGILSDNKYLEYVKD